MLDNVVSSEQLRGLAARKSKPDEYKSIRHALVEEEISEGWIEVKKNKLNTRLKKRKSQHTNLEDRVWTLLYRMGFTHLSAQGGAYLLLKPEDPKGPDNQIDVVAIDDEVAFAVECKSSQKPRKFADFSGDLAKHIAMRERFAKAVERQFPREVKRTIVFAVWTAGISPTENDRMRSETARVPLLTESELSYYESLVAQIGPAARYQFLADLLGGRPIPGLEITVPAIKIKMGKSVAFTFSVSPEYLLKIAFVSHRARGKPSDVDAYQRMLKKSRLRSIRQYISDGGIFPTNIVVNVAQSKWMDFDRGKQESSDKSSTFGWLHVRPAYRVAWIIDGQHRLFAYAGHPLAAKSLISVMAFVGLPASEQARLFVDINAEQRKVKQSLLQELYAELHWDAEEIEVRLQAILSKSIQSIDSDPASPLFGRVQKADDVRTDLRCISLTTIFKALEKSGFFISKMKKGAVAEYGPLWNVDNLGTMKRTTYLINGYFEAIRSEAFELWDKGSGIGGGLAMNNGVTACISVLRSIFHHLQMVKRVRFVDLDDKEILELITPFAHSVGRYFASMSPEQVAWFRRLQGITGQTTGTRRVEEAIKSVDPTFDPPGLKEFLDREKAQTTTTAFQVIHRVEQALQATVLSELKSEYGETVEGWWFNGVPKSVRKKVDDRINDEAGKKGGREENFDLIDYREVITDNWDLFGELLSRGKGNKDARTKWIVEVNELRKPVMHASKGVSLPITEEQLALLQEIESWLRGQLNNVDENSD